MSPASRSVKTPAGKIDVDAIVNLAARAPALPKPTGRIVRVRTAAKLVEAVESVEHGTTILLADGTYHLPNELWIRDRDRVTLRGASGRREKVVLDGGRNRVGTAVSLWNADDALVADLTIRNFRQMGVCVKGESDTQRTRVRNVVFHNVWTRGIKGTSPRQGGTGGIARREDPHVRKVRPAGGSIRYCLFHNDRAKWYEDGFGGDYISGIDMMWLKDWAIADNIFVGIRGRNGRGRGAIFIWNNSESVVAERNLIVHCDRGVAFGNPSGNRVHMIGGIVRNNVIVGGRGKCVEMGRTRNTLVCNNSIYAAQRVHPTVIFYQGAAGGRFVSNLLHGRLTCPKSMAKGNNLIGDLEGFFVDPAAGDLRLTPKAAPAVGKARPLEEVTKDFRGHKRPEAPTIGAFEP